MAALDQESDGIRHGHLRVDQYAWQSHDVAIDQHDRVPFGMRPHLRLTEPGRRHDDTIRLAGQTLEKRIFPCSAFSRRAQEQR